MVRRMRNLVLAACLWGIGDPAVAQDCDDPQGLGEAWGTVTGRLVDARTYGYHEDMERSEDEDWILFKAALFGPYLVLIEDGSDNKRPFYGTGEGSFDEIVKAYTPYVGRRVQVSGCLTEGEAWPSILDITAVELLE